MDVHGSLFSVTGVLLFAVPDIHKPPNGQQTEKQKAERGSEGSQIFEENSIGFYTSV